jgi:LCP family protein required for cell wall assembly
VLAAPKKGSLVIQGTSAQRAARASVAAADQPPLPHKRGTRRKLMLAFSLIALVFLAAIGYQGWKIVGAIVNAEHSAVVPWPTRDPSLAIAANLAGTTTPTPRLNPSPPATKQATSVAAPNVQVKVTPEPTVGDPATNTPESATALPTTSSRAPSPTPTPLLAQGTGQSSGLSVLGDLIGAGTENGDPGLSEIWGGRTSLNILVVGVDRRADGGDQNADVLIIAHLDLINKRVAAVSLPRDLLVQIPGIGPDKINGSYNYGILASPDDPAAGVAKVRDTIESVFGIPLDGYVLVDFNGFKDVVDSVGGVDINVPYAIEDDEYPTDDYSTEVVKFDPGQQHMDGDTALKYVRTRHQDSDDARRQRQYQVLLALFSKGKGFSSITKADKIILALGNSVQTNFDLQQQLALARIGMDLDESNIRLSALGPPLLTGGYIDTGAWVYTGDQATIVAFVQDALNTDGMTVTGTPESVATPAGG